MSLLMNALKKAESAKQGTSSAGTPAQGAIAGTSGDLTAELGLDPPSGQARSGEPDTQAPMSINRPGPLLKPMELALESEFAPSVAPAAAPNAAPLSLPLSLPGGLPGAQRRPVGRATEAESARAVFAAKQAKPGNSPLPFYLVVGACLLVAIGYGAHLWWQMQPPRPSAVAAGPAKSAAPNSAWPSPAAQSSPSSPAGEPLARVPPAPAGVADPAPQAPPAGLAGIAGPAGIRVPAASAAMRPDSQGSSRVPGQGGERGAAGEASRASAAAAPRRAAAPRDAASAAGGVAVEAPANLRIVRNANTVAVNPNVLAGYAALQAGDLERAGQAYDRALRGDPSNRDALLGAATVLLRLDRTDAAEAYFRQTLRLHPNDAYASAQLAALTARGDPVGALSQINSLIAREGERPDGAGGNGALAFVQGNQLAAQGRWPEAQQAYFNAHRADPGNADYCYNLAVGLDRMHEPRLARDFYNKAIELGRLRPASFDAARARARLAQLDAALK